MRIIVFGAGAIGSLFGGHLARENDVTLVCRKAHAKALSESGLAVKGLSEFRVRPKAAQDKAGLEPPDVLFLSVKAYDTACAIPQIRGLMAPGTVLVSLQNGLGNLELLREAFPDRSILACVTSHAAVLSEPGTVRHTGRSYTVVGGSGDSRKIADLLNRADLETAVSGDVAKDIWCKAIVNSSINPIATLLGERNGIIAERPDLAELVDRIVSEGVNVAQARGIPLSKQEALEKVMKVARETADNVCSMRMDIESGRRTEIMQMNGAIARYGAEAGVPTPANDIMVTLVRAKEPKAYHY